MTKSSTYWDKRSISRLTDAERISSESIAKIHEIYNKAYRDVEKEIQNVYENYSKDAGLDIQKLKELLTRSQSKKTWEQMKRQGLDKYIKNNYKARISKLEQIQAQTYAKVKLIANQEKKIQAKTYKGIINNSYYKAVYDTQMGTGYNFSFSQIDTKLVDRMISERWSGENYSSRIWKNTDILADSLSTTIGSSLLTGASINKISKEIRHRFNVGKYYSDRLVRTESNYFHNQADAMAYEEMGIDKYVFVAVLDNRTSEICQFMDNKVFEYSKLSVGENYPPLHPNCRSTTRGYLGKDAEEMLQRRARNPITGENGVINNVSYKEWIKKVNEIPPKESSKGQLTYSDVTKQWKSEAEPNTGKLINRTYYVDKSGKKYEVDGKNVVLDPTEAEVEMAKWLNKTFGGNVYINPRVNNPENVKTSDFLWHNEYWDLKTMSNRATSETRAVDNIIKKAKNQTDNIVLDITKTKLRFSSIDEQTKKIFTTKGREWVKRIILVDNYKLKRVYTRK